MAGRWSDDHIAASLNRMGLRTGQDKSWTAKRVSSIRRVNGIDAYFLADKTSDWCTMSEAARELGVTNHVIRRLIRSKDLPAHQVVPGAPYQIKRSDVQDGRVTAALKGTKRPCRTPADRQLPMFPDS
jgi:excisionase family DNA binding protein